ncbi:MAG TPA: hypothetical protein VFO85_22520, partial [Vicinamibacteria bacterium]|nr:hypothetical protein [Vicinamibacteria bacterium]
MPTPRRNTPARSGPASRAPAKKPTGGGPKGKGPGIGGGKRGQRLAASAAAYESPNIVTSPGYEHLAKGAVYGAYNQGDTLEQIRRNEWLNTLSLEDRERAMAHMGYFNQGVPQAVPKATKRDIRQYAGQQDSPGTYIMPNRSGQFEIGPDGEVVKGSVKAYRPAKGKVVGPEPKSGKQGSVATGAKKKPVPAATKAKSKSSAGGKRVTDAERKRIQRQKARRRGKGGGKGGASDSGNAAEESAEALAAPYAEADTTTTSMLRAQGKAYAAAREGYGNSRRGQESAGEEAEETEEEGKKRRRRRPRKGRNNRKNARSRPNKGRSGKRTGGKKKSGGK